MFLRITWLRQRTTRCKIMCHGDEKLLRRKTCDYLTAIFSHHDFFLETRRRPAIGCRPVSFQSEHHAFLDYLGVVERNQTAEYRLFPDRQTHAMTILQRERRLFVGKTELLGLWPEFDDVGRGDAWLHDTDRGI